jgi:hypothetical protein
MSRSRKGVPIMPGVVATLAIKPGMEKERQVVATAPIAGMIERTKVAGLR